MKDTYSIRIKFNSAYYLAKMERPFSDYNNLLKLQIKNKVICIKPKYESRNQAALFTDYIVGNMKNFLDESVGNARYFPCLIDGSTDSSVTEHEVVYVLFFDNGLPVVKYASIESVENANAGGVKKSIGDMFGGFVNKWKHASFPIPIASFLDVLSLIHCLSIAFQQEEHDPVKAV